jgi:hypothetical protein
MPGEIEPSGSQERAALLIGSMWSTLKDCEAFATISGSYVTFWRRKPELTPKERYRKQFTPGRVKTGCKLGRSPEAAGAPRAAARQGTTTTCISKRLQRHRSAFWAVN